MAVVRGRAWMMVAIVMTIAMAGCVEHERPYPKVDRSVLRLVSRLNSYREQAGLEQILPDTGRCDVLERVVPGFVSDEQVDFFGPEGLDLLNYYVSDCEKQCFIVTGRSQRQAIRNLEETPGFTEVLLTPEMTHLSAAFGETPSGDTWCAACISERLVHIVATTGSGHPYGGYVNFHGRTRFKDVMVEYFERPTAAGDQDTTIYRLHADMRESGAFRVGLPYGVEGGPRKGTMDIVFYARNDEDDAYRRTNRLRFKIPEPPK